MTLAIVFSAASLILCGFFFVYFQSCLRKKTAPREILEDYREEMHKLISEIDAATERDSLLVEERIKSLKNLLEEVDKKMEVYAREFERRRSTEQVYNALGRSPKTVPVPAPAAAPPAAAPPAPPPPAETPVPPPAPSPGPAPEGRSLKEKVAGLAAQGLPPDAIAARLKVSVSEVDLIIAIGDKP
jgi:hypothetical protein